MEKIEEALESHADSRDLGQMRPEVPNLKRIRSPQRKKIVITTIAACATIFGAIFAYPHIEEWLSTVETENAYVTGHVHPVSSRIAGTIEKVLVKDNELVKEGQVLAIIDPRDAELELQKAEAHLLKMQRDATASNHVVFYATRNASAVNENAIGNISQAKNAISKAQAAVREADAGVAVSKQLLAQREAELRKSELDLERYTSLEKDGAVATESLDTVRRDHDVALAARQSAIHALEQAKSRLNQTKADLQIANSQLITARASALQADAAAAQITVDAKQEESSRAAVKEAQADVDNAKLRLSYTKIVAPVSGRIGKKTVEEGQRIQPGTALLAVVSDEKWVVANYKETQLKNIRVGQKVKIAIDAYGDQEFTGKVDSFSPASGASFALLPPDNATGNFTKIVQRVPVKIVFDQKSLGKFASLISPGMSCIVKVWVR